MPDGTVPSSSEAVRAALSAARASLERQLSVAHTDAAEDALRQVQSALDLLPHQHRIGLIADVEWMDAVDIGSLPAVSARGADLSAPYSSSAFTSTPAASGNSASDDPVDDDGDDLTRIRGIDATLAARLAALGIRRFEQIAAWEIDDVRIIADAMGLGRRFLAMGVVDQARDFVRRRRDPRPAVERTASASTNAVAVWQPHPDAIAASAVLAPRSSEPWRPLDGAELARAVIAVRTRLPVNHIVSLAHLVPALAQPIYVATDRDTAVEMPRWRTGVLVPFVDVPETPDLTRFGPHARPVTVAAEKPRAPRTIVISAPTLDGFSPPSPPPRSIAEPPIHMTASARLTDLEAELETFPSVQSSRQTNQPVWPSTPNPIARVALPPANVPPPLTGASDDIEEADVKIVTSARPKSTRPILLAPLPELPLVKREAAHHTADPANPRKPHQVQEAAVIIVRRSPAAQPARPPVEHAGAVRRFLKAFARR